VDSICASHSAGNARIYCGRKGTQTQRFDSKNSGTKSPRHTTSIFCVDIRWKAFGATKTATPFVTSVKNTQPSFRGEKLFHRSCAALLPLTCKFPDRRNSLAPVLQVTVFWLNHSQALAVVWSYASPPSSPGGNAYECHSSPRHGYRRTTYRTSCNEPWQDVGMAHR
jgi:hypothetical protein